MAGDAFLGKFHRFLRPLTCAGRSELPEQCLPVWAEANVAWTEPCETIDIQLSWLTNMTIRTVQLFTQHRGRQMHRMWLPTEIQSLCVLHSGNGSHTPISILTCNANLSAIMYIKESIEYLEHRHIPAQLRSPMLLYDFLWSSTPWTKTKTPIEEQH